jgi:hypothetical protein
MRKILTSLFALMIALPLVQTTRFTTAYGGALQEQQERRVLTVPGKRRRRVRRDSPRGRGIGSAFKKAGKGAGRGGKRFGQNIARGRPIRAGKEMGKGMGTFGKNVGKGMARVGKRIAKP